MIFSENHPGSCPGGFSGSCFKERRSPHPMSTYRLDRLFAPRSLAIVGASLHEQSVGRSILRNVIAGGFEGPVHLVNSHYPQIEGLPAVASVAALPDVPDLAVIAVPPPAVPETVAAAAAKG